MELAHPVAHVLPLLGLAHLDRGFDYLVADKDDKVAQAGTRVRIRFHGRLVDGIVLERRAHSEHLGRLRYLERVYSEHVVYPQQTARLVESLAQRYGGTRADLIRTAIPPRHAQAESSDFVTAWDKLGEAIEPDLSGWSNYRHGQSFVDSVLARRSARAAWQITPGDDWAGIVASLLAKVAIDGGGALAVVPDQRDLDRVETALREHLGPKQITVLNAQLGAQARYRRFLSVLHGQARVVIGTRSAAYAPLKNLSLAVIIDDGDENLIEQRAPYAHAREVLTTRAGLEGCSLLIGGLARTAETQLLVEAGWMHGLLASRDRVRESSPLIRAAADTDFELEKDPVAAQARVPGLAFDAARRALSAGKPVLVQVPRKGYIPTLSCAQCRHPARCRICNGPVGLPGQDPAAAAAASATSAIQPQSQPRVATSTESRAEVPTCRWCGAMHSSFRCGECGSQRLRAVVLGTQRTAEELGRAFPSTRVITSGGSRVLDSVPDSPALVVATPGAEPPVDGGHYGAALLLDTWALLGRQDLRAAEDTLATWMRAAALVESRASGGMVIVVAEASLPSVQYLIRWDPVGAATAELAGRRETKFPPAVHMAAIDGADASLDMFLDLVELPTHAEVLGPVDLPYSTSLPGDYDEQRFGPPQRILVRTPLGPRAELGVALRTAAVARSLRKDELPLRIQVDPPHIG